ncbi:MAG: transcriptional repressor [Lentisphaeria bacterium]
MIRHTTQNAAIRQAFAEAGRPLTPPEALAAAQRHSAKVGIATVYRAIKRLAADGELMLADTVGETRRYELAGDHHHHHFHCRKCDQLYCLTGCPAGLQALTPPGFQLERHEIALFGVCQGCQAKANAKSQTNRRPPGT